MLGYDPKLEAASCPPFKVKGCKFQIKGSGLRLVNQGLGFRAVAGRLELGTLI